MDGALIIKNIKFWFDEKHPLFDDFSFEAAPGEVVEINGANGSGKSTLLRIVAGAITPRSGLLSFGGAIGWGPGSAHSFYERLTGRRNLEYFFHLKKPKSVFPRERASSLALECGLNENALDRSFSSYSTGMRQKLGLIRALIHDPELLLLDEPAASLDEAGEAACQRLIARFSVKPGKICVIASPQPLNWPVVTRRLKLGG